MRANNVRARSLARSLSLSLSLSRARALSLSLSLSLSLLVQAAARPGHAAVGNRIFLTWSFSMQANVHAALTDIDAAAATLVVFRLDAAVVTQHKGVCARV